MATDMRAFEPASSAARDAAARRRSACGQVQSPHRYHLTAIALHRDPPSGTEQLQIAKHSEMAEPLTAFHYLILSMQTSGAAAKMKE